MDMNDICQVFTQIETSDIFDINDSLPPTPQRRHRNSSSVDGTSSSPDNDRTRFVCLLGFHEVTDQN